MATAAQGGRDARDVASALDELQRAPREASDEREEAKMLDNPYSLSWSRRPAQQSTPDQRQEPVETVDDGQARASAAPARR